MVKEEGATPTVNTAEKSANEAALMIGRIVHYRTINDDEVPAIITRVRAGGSTLVDLQVFHYNKGCELATSVALGDAAERGTWHWPKR